MCVRVSVYGVTKFVTNPGTSDDGRHLLHRSRDR